MTSVPYRISILKVGRIYRRSDNRCGGRVIEWRLKIGKRSICPLAGADQPLLVAIQNTPLPSSHLSTDYIPFHQISSNRETTTKFTPTYRVVPNHFIFVVKTLRLSEGKAGYLLFSDAHFQSVSRARRGGRHTAVERNANSKF